MRTNFQLNETSDASNGANKKQRLLSVRRATLAGAGLALAASLGLTGASMASAAAPALTIKAHSIWTVEVKGGGCELVQFTDAGHTFVSDSFGDAGSWSGGNSTIGLTWTTGNDTGLTFSGKLVANVKPAEYKGVLGGTDPGGHAKLIKGEVSGC
jgi:hypothetical protein